MQTVRGGGGEAGGATKLLGCGMFVAVWKTITDRVEGGDGVIDTKLWLCENYTPGSSALDNSDLVDHTAIIIRYTCFSVFLFVNISAMDADSTMMTLILFDDNDVEVV